MTADSNKNLERKLKIGILIRDLEKLENWEYRILQGIIEHPCLELSLFIKDGRKQGHSPKDQIGSNILLSFQCRIESLVFKNKKIVNSNDVLKKIASIETIYLNPAREGFLDNFTDEESDKVKRYDLDLILQHEFNNISGNILQAARFGIWCYHHSQYTSHRSGSVPWRVPYAGFWEIVNNEPCCCIALEKLAPEGSEGQIIDRAWLNWYFSFFKTNYDLLEESAVLLFKNIEKLLINGEIEFKDPLPCYIKPGKKISFGYFIIYTFRFYLKIFNYIINMLFPIKRFNCWALFFGKGVFLETDFSKFKPAPLPKKVFWADPFLYRYENRLYVFFEKYIYKTRKGIISAGRVVESEIGKYSVVDVQDIFDFNYHLSYPCIVNEDGQIFMIPETHQNKRLEVYRCLHFPEKWELFATAFDGEEIVDTTYFCDDNGDKWLFMNKGWSYNSELYIYKIDSLKLGRIVPHKLNPVMIDCRKGRSGGKIFRYEDNYYRTSQINTHGMYGKGLHISKIRKLTLEEYEDEAIISIEPNFMKGLAGMHHLHQFEDNFVFDACFKTL